MSVPEPNLAQAREAALGFLAEACQAKGGIDSKSLRLEAAKTILAMTNPPDQSDQLPPVTTLASSFPIARRVMAACLLDDALLRAGYRDRIATFLYENHKKFPTLTVDSDCNQMAEKLLTLLFES